MPLDYDGKHATGDCVKLSTTGEWVTEYEDEEYEDAPDCVETWKDGEENYVKIFLIFYIGPYKKMGAITLRRNDIVIKEKSQKQKKMKKEQEFDEYI